MKEGDVVILDFNSDLMSGLKKSQKDFISDSDPDYGWFIKTDLINNSNKPIGYVGHVYLEDSKIKAVLYIFRNVQQRYRDLIKEREVKFVPVLNYHDDGTIDCIIHLNLFSLMDGKK